MGKLYKKYLELKQIDNSKYYLFKCGNFYLFLDEDAKNINKITTLKLTKLNDEVVKCGFPTNSIEKYTNIFENLNLVVEIIDKIDVEQAKRNLLNKIKNLDIDNTTPLKALKLLKELKEVLNV
ncbi:MAG TPA: hypothetical protein PLX66_00065 [Bacilli bacterium]|nr:hypothetical protein [Bacilli bacterium]